MSIEVRLLEGLAELLASSTSARWSSEARYLPGVMGIYIDVVPATMDDALTLSDYVVSDDPTLSDSVIGVQVRSRRCGADPRPVKETDAEVYDVLHGYQGTLTTGVRVVSCYRQSGDTLGQDDNDRWRRVSNYYVLVHKPSANRT